jgi:8-oxo-dGTP pyrophosphatase MutT (NUDIX family)
MTLEAGGFADPPVLVVQRLALRLVQKPWPWAAASRNAIDGHFAALKRERPSVWNGRVLLQHRQTLTPDLLEGEFLETDFASIDAWRALGRPDPSVKDCFAAVAICTADGAWLLVEMGPQTANAGLIYFCAGVPDPADVVGGIIDFEHSAWRELFEETGLTRADVVEEPGWAVINERKRTAVIKVVHMHHAAEPARDQLMRNIGQQSNPELSDIRIVRSAADLDTKMPPFVGAFLQYRWAQRR